MTPEEARGLLEAATPGPWRAFMATSGQVIVDSGKLDNAGDVPLATAAPALAETVAGLRYEYAVQVERDGVWVVSEDSSWGSYSVAVVRYGRTEEPARIVRRLVSEPEVVE